MPSLHLRHVCVEFPIYQGSSRSLKKILISGTTKGNLARDAFDRVNVRALSDVSFDVENGERFGIIGVKRDMTRQQLLRHAIDCYLAAAKAEYQSACGCLAGEGCRGEC